MRKLFVGLMLSVLSLAGFAAEQFIVKDGKPNAQIVVAAENRSRMATLAALDLRYYIEKLTGARLPIVTNPTDEVPVKIYVGKSAGTEKLGVSSADLKDGAYRIVSGLDWLVLIGDDFDFDPSKYPLSMKRGDKTAQEKWKAATKDKADGVWACPWPFSGAFKRFWKPNDFQQQLSARYGADAPALWGTNDGFWLHDENGSLNAVCAFLRSLGVRWYMAGELGEVLPEKMRDLKLGTFNETVKADYPIRDWTYYNYEAHSFDDLAWARRIGMNSRFQQLGLHTGPHGLIFVYIDEEMRKKHPEFFALASDGTRLSTGEKPRECFSNEGLFKETVNFIRFMFDTYDFPSVDIWPADGYVPCSCENCKGKKPSDLVWGFTDRVAREVYKTHPDKLITGSAYTVYSEAPDSIEKFSPNLGLWIANSGRPKMMDDDYWNAYFARVQKWNSKLAPGNIIRSENNRYHIQGTAEAEDGKKVRGRSIGYPVIHPRAVARELKALKGISRGDTGEQSQVGGKWKVPGIEHITLYVQSRFLWDADLDVDEVLNEYCQNFYGPAAKQMKAAIDFAEANLAIKDTSRGAGKSDLQNVSLELALKLRELLKEAKVAAGESVYGKRIDLILSEMISEEELIAKDKAEKKLVAEARANAPVAVGVEGSDLSKAPEYFLKNNSKVGEEPQLKTSFKAGWDKNALILEITCKEPEVKNLAPAVDVYSGEFIAITIETQLHRHYILEINPDGLILDGDPTRGWKSLAEAKPERGEDFWRLTVRIPVVGKEEALADPKHRVAGEKPTPESPWYINIGREIQKKDDRKHEIQLFSPSQKTGWHDPVYFGKLEIK